MISREEFASAMEQRWENVLQKHTRFVIAERAEIEAKAFASVVSGAGAAEAVAKRKAATAEDARTEAYMNLREAISQFNEFVFDWFTNAIEHAMARQ